MDSAALQKYLRQLFERHGVELDADEDGWLVTDDDFPAVRAGRVIVIDHGTASSCPADTARGPGA